MMLGWAGSAGDSGSSVSHPQGWLVLPSWFREGESCLHPIILYNTVSWGGCPVCPGPQQVTSR